MHLTKEWTDQTGQHTHSGTDIPRQSQCCHWCSDPATPGQTSAAFSPGPAWSLGHTTLVDRSTSRLFHSFLQCYVTTPPSTLLPGTRFINQSIHSFIHLFIQFIHYAHSVPPCVKSCALVQGLWRIGLLQDHISTNPRLSNAMRGV